MTIPRTHFDIKKFKANHKKCRILSNTIWFIVAVTMISIWCIRDGWCTESPVFNWAEYIITILPIIAGWIVTEVINYYRRQTYLVTDQEALVDEDCYKYQVDFANKLFTMQNTSLDVIKRSQAAFDIANQILCLKIGQQQLAASDETQQAILAQIVETLDKNS
jgi:hypothetical protein